MSDVPFISVIIPVYNVEKYLRQCLDSVIIQKYSRLEIIIVDDGSTDNSPSICDEYLDKNDSIQVFHKENGGSSDARNYGISVASGKFLMFLDSDDYWSDGEFLNILDNKLQSSNPDVLIYGCIDYSCISGNKQKSRISYNNVIFDDGNKEFILKYLFSSGLFPGAAWLTITRRQFVVQNNLYFEKGIKAEDIDWLLNVFLHAKKYASVNDCFYIYRKYRKDSITGSADIKSINDIFFSIEKWSNLLEEDKFEKIKPYANTFLVSHFFTTLIIYHKLSNEHKRIASYKIKTYSYLLKDLKTTRTRYASLLFQFLGLNLTSIMLNFIYEVRKR